MTGDGRLLCPSALCFAVVIAQQMSGAAMYELVSMQHAFIGATFPGLKNKEGRSQHVKQLIQAFLSLSLF